MSWTWRTSYIPLNKVTWSAVFLVTIGLNTMKIVVISPDFLVLIQLNKMRSSLRKKRVSWFWKTTWNATTVWKAAATHVETGINQHIDYNANRWTCIFLDVCSKARTWNKMQPKWLKNNYQSFAFCSIYTMEFLNDVKVKLHNCIKQDSTTICIYQKKRTVQDSAFFMDFDHLETPNQRIT